jgi:hypothetical protein
MMVARATETCTRILMHKAYFISVHLLVYEMTENILVNYSYLSWLNVLL